MRTRLSDIPMDRNCTYDFVLLASNTYGNPNGDPDNGNEPRTNPFTRQGMITDVCTKRKVRDYVLMQAEADPEKYIKDRIFIQSDEALNAKLTNTYTELGLKLGKEGTVKKDVDTAKAYMLDNYFDVRMFGAVMNTGKNRADIVTGAVAIPFAVSVDPVNLIYNSLTRKAQTLEEKADQTGSTFANKTVVEFGLYKAACRYNAHQGIRNGVTADDLALLFDALINMYNYDLSAARGLMKTQKLVIFKHPNANAVGAAEDYGNLIKVTRTNTQDEFPHSMEDYEIIIDTERVPSGVEVYDVDMWF